VAGVDVYTGGFVIHVVLGVRDQALGARG